LQDLHSFTPDMGDAFSYFALGKATRSGSHVRPFTHLGNFLIAPICRITVYKISGGAYRHFRLTPAMDSCHSCLTFKTDGEEEYNILRATMTRSRIVHRAPSNRCTKRFKQRFAISLLSCKLSFMSPNQFSFRCCCVCIIPQRVSESLG
jgi:hypothetical protein